MSGNRAVGLCTVEGSWRAAQPCKVAARWPAAPCDWCTAAESHAGLQGSNRWLTLTGHVLPLIQRKICCLFLTHMCPVLLNLNMPIVTHNPSCEGHPASKQLLHFWDNSSEAQMLTCKWNFEIFIFRSCKMGLLEN